MEHSKFFLYIYLTELDENMRVKLQELLESQIAGLLTRIEEEKPYNDEEDEEA